MDPIKYTEQINQRHWLIVCVTSNLWCTDICHYWLHVFKTGLKSRFCSCSLEERVRRSNYLFHCHHQNHQYTKVMNTIYSIYCRYFQYSIKGQITPFITIINIYNFFQGFCLYHTHMTSFFHVSWSTFKHFYS